MANKINLDLSKDYEPIPNNCNFLKSISLSENKSLSKYIDRRNTKPLD